MFFGLGKKRSKFGKFVDREEIRQIDIEVTAKLSRGTISRLCNDPDHVPTYATASKVIRALKRLGHNVDQSDFWRGM
jgi:hypothetical protein